MFKVNENLNSSRPQRCLPRRQKWRSCLKLFFRHIDMKDILEYPWFQGEKIKLTQTQCLKALTDKFLWKQNNTRMMCSVHVRRKVGGWKEAVLRAVYGLQQMAMWLQQGKVCCLTFGRLTPLLFWQQTRQMWRTVTDKAWGQSAGAEGRKCMRW